jgi:hypothetical protein
MEKKTAADALKIKEPTSFVQAYVRGLARVLGEAMAVRLTVSRSGQDIVDDPSISIAPNPASRPDIDAVLQPHGLGAAPAYPILAALYMAAADLTPQQLHDRTGFLDNLQQMLMNPVFREVVQVAPDAPDAPDLAAALRAVQSLRAEARRAAADQVQLDLRSQVDGLTIAVSLVGAAVALGFLYLALTARTDQPSAPAAVGLSITTNE